MSQTSAEQMENLRRMAEKRTLSVLSYSLFTLAAASAVAAIIYNHHPFLYFLGGFFLLIGITSRQSSPFILEAAKALEISTPRQGTFEVKIEEWSDSPTYRARFHHHDSGSYWNFEFIPQGWSPVAGRLEGQLYFLPDHQWPSLIVTEKGILFPRFKPKRETP